MSQENVEIVRLWIQLFNRRDIKGLKELTEPDFEMRSLLLAVESDFRGDVDFPGAYFEALDDAYQRFQSVPDDFTDAGTAVVVSTRLHWRGKGSGAHGETPIFAAFWLRAGKVFKEETFTDRTQALEAVGMSEQDANADSP